jgi:hypothetical protein
VSTDPAAQQGEATDASAGPPGEPTEDELRAAYEAELSRITPAEVMLQSAVSLLNIGARRLGLTGGGDPSEPPGASPGAAERDLEQVRDAIDGVRALLGILERTAPQELRPLRDALSQLQIAFARETQAGGNAGQPAPPPAADPSGSPAAGAAQEGEGTEGPGPAQSSGRLWVPGS